MSKPSAQPSKIKTQDEPFNLQALEDEAANKDFQFDLGGRVFVMKALGRLDRKARKSISRMVENGAINQADYIDEMLKLAMGEEQFAEFDELPLSGDGEDALFRAWSSHSGIEIPESPASTDS